MCLFFFIYLFIFFILVPIHVSPFLQRIAKFSDVFYFVSLTPTDPCIFHAFYPPIPLLPLHVPYFPELPPCLYIFSTVLYLGQLFRHPYGVGSSSFWCTTVPDLTSYLSFEQMVGFSLVPSLLGFLGCES